MTTREQQIAWEEEDDHATLAARLEEVKAALAAGDVDLPKHTVLIARAATPVREYLERYLETARQTTAVQWLSALDLDVAAVLAIRTVMQSIALSDTMSSNTPCLPQSLAEEIGRAWELEVLINEAAEVSPGYVKRVDDQIKRRRTKAVRHIRAVYFKTYRQVMKGELSHRMSRIDAIHLGKLGMEACAEAGIIELQRGVNRRGMLLTIQYTEEVAEFLTRYDPVALAQVTPLSLTYMIYPPDPYTNLFDGGYLSENRKRRRQTGMLLGRALHAPRLRSLYHRTFCASVMPEVFRVANYLQSIPYTFHKPTVAALERLWDAGGGTLGVPSKNPPVAPAMPLGEDWDKEGAPEDELEVFQTWKRQMAQHYENLGIWRGRVREISGFLKAMHRGHERVWFPVAADTRGRWYYRGTPNPQGSDLAKAVIQFADPKPLGERGLFWLKVHIANCMGFDKERNAARAAWVDARWEAIERALDAPEDYPEVFGTDLPWCAFAAAWELREALRSGDPAGYCTGIIVHQDASCSGLQHFSALLRDEVGARYTNLIDSGGPVKADIYTKVAAVATARIAQEAVEAAESTDTLEERLKRLWGDLVASRGISRQVAKKPVMTYLYSATLLGIADDIRSNIAEDYPNLDEKLLSSIHTSLVPARHLVTGIQETVPAAASMLGWLREAVQRGVQDRPLIWTAPTGFKVAHYYQGFEEKRVHLRSLGISKVLVRDFTDTTRTRAMLDAIAPNFVHSLDAAHLTKTADVMRERGLCMVGIHDSFGTHPCDVDAMGAILRDTFIRMYEDNPDMLADFLVSIGSHGEIPHMGTLDLQAIRDSEFFFS